MATSWQHLALLISALPQQNETWSPSPNLRSSRKFARIYLIMTWLANRLCTEKGTSWLVSITPTRRFAPESAACCAQAHQFKADHVLTLHSRLLLAIDGQWTSPHRRFNAFKFKPLKLLVSDVLFILKATCLENMMEHTVMTAVDSTRIGATSVVHAAGRGKKHAAGRQKCRWGKLTNWWTTLLVGMLVCGPMFLLHLFKSSSVQVPGPLKSLSEILPDLSQEFGEPSCPKLSRRKLCPLKH